LEWERKLTVPAAYRCRKRPYRVGDVVPVSGVSARQDAIVVLHLDG